MDEQITNCLGYGCPLANTCKRFNPNPKQGDMYFKGVPFKDDGGFIECVRWIDINHTHDKLMERLNDSK